MTEKEEMQLAGAKARALQMEHPEIVREVFAREELNNLREFINAVASV